MIALKNGFIMKTLDKDILAGYNAGMMGIDY